MATMPTEHPVFQSFLKSFYIRSINSTQIKTLKLEVLNNLANETRVLTVLQKFQTYIHSMDRDFMAP